MSPARPARLVVVAGTGTEVGKTWVTAHVARELRAAGTVVAARKPAQSFEPGDVEAGRTDAQLLGEATGTAAAAVCPPHRWFEVPMAPPMAADALGRAPFTLDELVAELVWPDGVDVGVVETAGGLRSPLADDGDAVTLVRALAPDVVVLVADAGLGTINTVRLTMAALRDVTGAPVLVHLNRFDPDDDLHRRNAEWLTKRDGYIVTTSIAALSRTLTVTSSERA